LDLPAVPSEFPVFVWICLAYLSHLESILEHIFDIAAPLPDDGAVAAVRAVTVHLEDGGALAACTALIGTWSSEDLLTLGEAVVGRLAERTLGGAVSDAALHESIGRLERLKTRTEAEKLRRVREVGQRGSHVGEGARTPADLLTRLGLTRGEAREQEEMADALGELPKIEEALAKGRIGPGQAAEAAKALNEARQARRRDPDADGAADERLDAERDAIDEAVANSREGTDRKQTREELERLAARRSRDRLAERERRARRKRHGRKYRDGDGYTIKLHGTAPVEVLLRGRGGE
jgi:hypothetical protein